MGGIDKTKLQQLKAYQPPKLDYLAQKKYVGGLATANQNRQNLISADASNLSNNPRLISKQIIEKGLIENKGSAHDKIRESSDKQSIGKDELFGILDQMLKVLYAEIEEGTAKDEIINLLRKSAG